MSWLLSLILVTVLPQISTLTMVSGVWFALEHVYSSMSKSRILWLRRQLQFVKRESSTIVQYLGNIGELVDVLALTGSPIPDEVLNDVLEEFIIMLQMVGFVNKDQLDSVCLL